MKPADFFRAIVYPVTEISILVPLIVFWLLVLVMSLGGLLGQFIIFLFIVPAIFRFQMIVLEARARGVTPATPGIEFFNWFGNAWTVFPVLLVVLLAWMTVTVAQNFGTAWAIPPVILASFLFPASIAVLAVTHSPLQSLNPVALGRLWKRCGSTFWLATLFLVFSSWLAVEVAALPGIWASLVQLSLAFSFFSLVGSLIRPYGLIEDIEIHEPTASDETATARELEKARTDVLNHAYAFISRDNRDGGFNHVFDRIQEDPDPVAAWAWFFAEMLRWEDKAPALIFAQHYLHDQLQHGEWLAAVKLILRCRLLDERFRPLPEDEEAAISACEACSNAELAAILRRN